MRIIFLDIDGVLNSTRSSFSNFGYPSPSRVFELSKTSIGRAVSVAKFDPIAVGVVRRLCNDLDLKIVLSSTWRKHKDYMDLASILNLPIIGRTPDLPSGFRGDEVQLWIDRTPPVADFKYAIIDDDSDFHEYQKPFFVKTSIRNGITWENVERIMEIFGKQVKNG